ncbi:uncharacterized protein LOC132702266 [Cylas formicarius]|uniref:uncharacterized protein LOC132702266 n=1 Tax=Cylas formicarius TaxID=197179 RepID=UPI0029585689|nr:uncharacterized protein LOC132702266 [Cylas formicarius]
MNFKVITIFFSLLLVAQATPTLGSNKDTVQTVLKVVVDIFGKVLDAFSQGVTAISNSTRTRELLEAGEVKLANTLYDVVTDKLDQLMDDFKPITTEDVVDILTCVELQKDAARLSLNTTVYEIGVCTTQRMDSIVKVNEDAVTSLTTLYTDLKRIESDLEKCFLGDLCLAEVIANIGKLQSEALAVVADLLSLLNVYKDLVLGDVPACAVDQLIKLPERNEEIVLTAINCILGSMAPKENRK